MPKDEKRRNRTNFYSVMLLMYTGWDYWNILTQKNIDKFLTQFKILLVWFLRHFVPKYILRKYSKKFSSQRFDKDWNSLWVLNLKCAKTHMSAISLAKILQLFLWIIYILEILGHCNTENYARRLVVIQNLYEL